MSDNLGQLGLIFQLQTMLQYEMLKEETPVDSVENFKYSILALMGEIGELLESDRRWKNIRGDEVCDEKHKLDELSDCMAFLINAYLYSGFTAEDAFNAFLKKSKKNFKRIRKEHKKKGHK